jgi:hypothetical protein
MTALPDLLRDDPQVAVTILTTEHFNLQTARAATISETGGRASVFLGSVSAGLVALAFAGQASRTALYTFGLVLFPVLCFLGLVTFERVLQASIDDTHLILRINRIRRFYVEAAPQLAPYLARPAASDDVAAVLRTEGYYRTGRWQLMVSIVGALGVIDSVLFGVTAGLIAGALSDSNLWVATPVGLAVFAVSLPLHQHYQQVRRAEAHAIELGE